MLLFRLGNQVRLVVIETVEIGIYTIIYWCKACIFTIRSHVFIEATFLQYAIESCQIVSVTNQLCNGLLV